MSSCVFMLNFCCVLRLAYLKDSVACVFLFCSNHIFSFGVSMYNVQKRSML